MTLRMPDIICLVTGRLQVLRRTSLLPAILVLGTAGRHMRIIDMERVLAALSELCPTCRCHTLNTTVDAF